MPVRRRLAPPARTVPLAISRRDDDIADRVTARLVAAGWIAGTARTWFACAALLALVDGRFGRRAAMRGLLSAGLAATVARGALRRPAGASAFASGAAQELPVLGVPLGALACVAGYPGLRAGALRPRGALLATALGAAAGVATRRLWPVAPHDGAGTRARFPAAALEPSPDGRGLVIVVNAAAGRGAGTAEELRASLPSAEVVELEDGADIAGTLRDAAGRARAIGVAGGDGSVNTAADLAAAAGKPLLVVPAGTLNHFAAALGIHSVAGAVDAVHEGRIVAVDRGLIAGHTFVNTASIGSYCDLVDARERLERRIGKWPAVVVALWRVLHRAEPVAVEIDGRARSVWMVFMGNCRYHPAGFAPSWRERLDDGTLDVRIVDGARPWSRALLLLSVLTGRLARCRAYEQRFVREMSVTSLGGPLRLARDGETFDGPASFTVAKAGSPLLVYAPARS